MNQTAVEWLYETLWKQTDFSLPNNILEQAKAMEKEQMEDNKDEYRWTYSEIFDACFPTLGRGGDWAAIAKKLIEQKENK